MMNYTEDIKKRIRNPKYLNLITTAKDAAKYIENGMVIGMSGFTPSDYPKLIPLALIDRKKAGEEIKIDVYAGATLGQEVDVKMVQEGMIRKRLPFMNNPVPRAAVNNNDMLFIDMHLSQSAQYVNYGFLPALDFAVVEVLGITEEGDLIPSTAVGNTAAFIRACDRVLVEIAMKKPLEMEGMHDIWYLDNPPNRREIPIYKPSDRIGTPTIPCGWDKIKAIVLSDGADSPKELAPIDDTSREISKHVIAFLKKEVEEGRLTNQLLPLQSGVGNVANAVLVGLQDAPFHNLTAYTEVVQDAMLDLLRTGKLDFVSATCATLSPEGLRNFFRDIEFFRDKIIFRPEEISNHPETARRLGVIAINTAIEADIYGNVNSSHIMGSRIMNGIGGSGDFSRNAAITIFTTPSTAKNGDISSIVPMVSHVDHTEHEVMVLVTEFGYADLRGLAPKERAIKIIENCAHPDYKDKLMDYFVRACEKQPCQTPHILKEALSWHVRFEENGTMR